MRLTLRSICLSAISVLLFSSCQPDKKNVSGILNTDGLASYTYSVDVNRDTVLQTPDGVLIHVPAQALDAGGTAMVKLEIREAIRMSEIIRAGLLTQADGKPLSSGGMIQIVAAAGQSVKIIKSIGVSIPTTYIDPKMQVYKGVTNGIAVTNWTDPQPLLKNAQAIQLDTGKQLFASQCASCHAIDKTITGPALAYISRLRNQRWLYAFTRNSKGDIDSVDRYVQCLFNQYGPMPVFPRLNDPQLGALYSYIDNESKRLQLPLPADHLKKCVDSCNWYDSEHELLMNHRNKLIGENGKQVEITRTPSTSPIPDSRSSNRDTDNYIPPKMLPKVDAPYYQSVYYQFNIQSFGWYNIDVLVSETDGAKKSELILRLQGAYTSEMNVFLIVPFSKIFAQGGPLTDKNNEFGFYTVDGSIYLQQSVKAMVMVMGEKDGKIFFDMASFQTSLKQTLTLTPTVITKDQMNDMLKSLDLPDINMQVQVSKNSEAIKATDLQLRDLEKFRPKTCDCHCGSITDATIAEKENMYLDTAAGVPKN